LCYIGNKKILLQEYVHTSEGQAKIYLKTAPSPDPEIEIMSQGRGKPALNKTTPVAAWMLVLLLAIHTVMRLPAADNTISEIFQLYTRKNIVEKKRTKPYSRSIMIFSMTLAGYSMRAYNFLRSVANKCLPSENTLRRYRQRVDGSPGFSVAALKMIRNKVSDLATTTQKLFISLSCDDMSIRQHLWFTGKLFL
jgi:hypothetical protein